MYERRNTYLDRRMRERDMRMRGRERNDYRNDYNMSMRDGRNPYGSRGGYVTSDRSNGMRDSRMDYRNDYAERDYRYDYRNNTDYRNTDYARSTQHYGEYHRPYEYPMMPDYNYERDYGDMEKEYEEDLHKWIKKLEKMDTRIRVSKQQIINQARNMNIKFKEYDEDEFYATYLMIISDFPNVSNDYNVYIGMAKNWLEDKDAKLQGSDKLCTYMYEIVLGKSKEEDDD